MSREITNEEFEKAFNDKDNKNTINKVIWKYSRQIDRHDLEDCGLQGLWNCLKKHEDGRQKFTSSLYRFVTWECLRKLEANKREIKTVSLSYLDKNSTGEWCTYDDVARNSNDEPVDSKQADILECLNLLSNNHKNILVDYYYKKMSMQEIGKKHGYTKETARQNINKALKILKKQYGEM